MNVVGSNLRQTAVRGAAFLTAGSFARQVIRFGSMALLARWVPKDEHGKAAIALSVILVIAVFRDLGLGEAAVRRRDLDDEQLDSIFWFNVLACVALAALTAILAPIVGWYYEDPALVTMTAVLGGSLVVTGLGTQHLVMLRREMRFARIAAIETWSAAFAAIGALAMAWYGMGYWALLGQNVLAFIGTTALAWWWCRWRPEFRFKPKRVWSVASHGSWLAGSEILSNVTVNSGPLILGKLVSDAATGLYTRAFGLLTLPLRQISTPLFRVAIPTLAAIQEDPPRFARAYLRIALVLQWATAIPIMVLAGASNEIIRLYLGPDWAAAAILFEILAFSTWGGPASASGIWVLMALGRGRRHFLLELGGSIALIAGMIAGALIGQHAFDGSYGAEGLCVGTTIALIATRIPRALICFHETHIRYRDYLRAISPPGIIALLVWATMRACGAVMPTFSTAAVVQDALSLVVKLVVGGAATLLLVVAWPHARQDAIGALSLFRDLRRRRGDATDAIEHADESE